MPYNFTSLRAKILSDAKRPSLTDKGTEAILAAEEELNRVGRFAEMSERTTLTSADRSADDPTIYNTPADFLDARRLRFGDSKKPLRRVGAKYVDQASDGKLRFYSVLSKREIQFNKAPADEDVFYLMYFAKVPNLDETTTTNRVLENQSSIYINLALAEMYKYTEDLELANTVAQAALAAITELNEQASRALRAGGEVKAGPYNFCSKSAQ